jgi:hypothetical protein
LLLKVQRDIAEEVTLEFWMLKISSMLLTHGRQIDIARLEMSAS